MAGAGYKLFQTGSVLTAADVNTYLNEQSVMVFADASARTTALSGVLAEGMITYLKSDDKVYKYTGSAWVEIGGGGGASPLTTKGDLYTYSSSDTRLAVGTDGQYLTADASTSTGLKWASPSSGGLVLIGTTSFSAASTVNINDVFSATYTNYRIVAEYEPSQNGDLLFRYRVSGADNTTTNYNLQIFDFEDTTSSGARLTGQTNSRLGACAANQQTHAFADLSNPYASKKKRINVIGARGNNSTSAGIITLMTAFDATTSFTGFTIYVAQGTVSGTISVYGYAK